MAKNVTDADFQSVVMESEKVVLVDFWAEWCGPCRSLSKVIDELSTKYRGVAEIVKYNVDENTEFTNRYGVRGLPTILIFRGGSVVKTLNGAVPRERIEKELSELI